MRVECFNDPRDSVLLKIRRWHLARPAARPGFARGAAGVSTPEPAAFALPAVVEVASCRVHGDGLVASLPLITVREVAEALRGCEVAVSRSDFPPAGRDEYYWVDLIGCQVSTPEGVALGVVDAVDDHGAHPLLRLRADDGRERLIPFVDAHVPVVDVAGRRIVADWDPDF